MKGIVNIIDTKDKFGDLKPGDNFIFEPNRALIYTKLRTDDWMNRNESIIPTNINAVDQNGRCFYFGDTEFCKKVEAELKVSIKE